MTKKEFQEKYYEMSVFNTNDVLMRVASNLSDLQIEKTFFTPDQMDEKLNNLKRYIFDYMAVLRIEEQNKRYEQQEMDEFNAHLGKF